MGEHETGSEESAQELFYTGVDVVIRISAYNQNLI